MNSENISENISESFLYKLKFGKIVIKVVGDVNLII